MKFLLSKRFINKIVEKEEERLQAYKQANFSCDIKKQFVTNLRKEEYFPLLENFYTSYHSPKEELVAYESYSKKNLAIVRKKEQEDPNNPYIRSLFLSAFLRCIFALLESPVEMEIKDGMIEKLTEKNTLRDLACLVETCISGEFNIPSKFIEIIQFILLNPKNKTKSVEEEDIETPQVANSEEDINELYKKIEQEEKQQRNITYIANLIKKIINKIRYKLSIENDEHKILLFNICQCSTNLCNLLNYQHPIIKSVHAFDNKINKKYIIADKLDEYVDFSIVDVFIGVITEYMKEENAYFMANSSQGDSNSKKNNAEDEEEDCIKAEEDDEKTNCEDLIELEERIQNNNEIQILNLLINPNCASKGDTADPKGGAKKFSIDETLINLISYIPIFLGEYMSKSSDQKVYEIFENFSRSNVFRGINIRKSYIKEIIDLMNTSKKRKLISGEYKTLFMTRVNMVDLRLKTNKWYLLYVFDNELCFQEIKGSDNERDDLLPQEDLKYEGQDENKFIEKIKKKVYTNKKDKRMEEFSHNDPIPFEMITAIFTFDIKNRIMLKLGRGINSGFKLLFFKKFYVSNIIINFIKLNNCQIKMIEDIPILINEEELEKESQEEALKERINKNDEKLEEAIEIKNLKKLEEGSGDPEEEEKQTTTPNNGNMININGTAKPPLENESNLNQEEENKIIAKKEEDQKQLEKLKETKNLEKLKKNPNENVIIYCNIPLKNFFDFIINIFKSEKEILEKNASNLADNRILKVDGKNFEIYNEIPEKFFEIDLEILNDDKINISEITKQMKKCFQKYDSKEVTKWTDIEIKHNTLKITISSDTYEIHCFDDYSMLKLKSCFFYHRGKEVAIKNKENYKLLDNK